MNMNHGEQDEPLGEAGSCDMPDRIDVLLRQSVAEIGDEGFTRALLSALPRRRSSWLRPVILLGSSAFSLIFACLWPSWKAVLLMPAQAPHGLNLESLTPWLLLAGVVFPLLLAIADAFPVFFETGPVNTSDLYHRARSRRRRWG